jgi:hypothetical protein
VPPEPTKGLTALDAFVAIGEALDCLLGWNDVLDALDASPELGIDTDDMARALCSFHAYGHAALRAVERQAMRAGPI